tara:strand:+ start:167 stop:655 length:489 start_codon:yes stop_codon:yes gene_type:complete
MKLVDIKDYKGLYSFDLNTNKVWSHKHKKYIKEYIHKGYYCLSLSNNYKRKMFLFHRLIYQYHNLDKDITNLCIDHIDRNKLNNNIENLRISTYSENSCNKKVRNDNKFGIKNITLTKNNTYKVDITKNKNKYCKTFKTLEEAIEYKKIKLNELHGEYANLD